MLDSILKNPNLIAQWVTVIVMIIGVYKKLKDADKKDKLKFIKEAVPMIHNVIQKIAPLTKTTKDDLFIEKMDELLKAVGWKIEPEEVAGIKALAEGHHQDFKAAASAEKNLEALGILLPESESSEPVE